MASRTHTRRDFLTTAGATGLGVALGCRAPVVTSPAVHGPPDAPPEQVTVRPVEAFVQDVAASRAQEGATSPSCLPSPDLTDARILCRPVGLRPYRRRTFRLEREQLAGRTVIHNYGHGGAGITLSFGCAAEVTDMACVAMPPPAEVVVLGAGVCGLTCALRLQEAGYGVRVVARDFPPHTTSNIAGGQFSPSLVAYRDSHLLERLLRRSHAGFTEVLGSEFGVEARANYATRGAGTGLNRLPHDLAPRRELERLPFEGTERRGFVVHTLLIETPVLLARLQAELEARHVAFEQRDLIHRDEVRELQAEMIVNCVGLGAAELWDDALMTPIRGQLVHIEPQDLPYMLSHRGYLFPRRDALILGGTAERGSTDTTPDAGDCARILANHRSFFGQRVS